MKKIRIGVGSGGCSYERLEPAMDLIEYGNLDYLIFECLAERTIAEAQREKLLDPESGYNPMLEIRMHKMLKRAKEKNIKIVSNMGGANTSAAMRAVVKIAEEQQIHGLKIAVVYGDDITEQLMKYEECPLLENKGLLRELENVIAANVYLGADGIKDALDAGADVVITGRVADPSLFVGPIRHEFGFDMQKPQQMGQAVLLGHLLECCAQITGGYYADPGMKDIEALDRLGFPIAEMDETGLFTITKLSETGGAVNVDICKEQLLYEIKDPSAYITPDGVADFSKVRFKQVKPDKVLVEGAQIRGVPDMYKVNIAYSDSYIGTAEISYGGPNCLERARIIADAVQKRWNIIGVEPVERRVDFIGYNSLYGNKIAQIMSDGICPEVRLRIAVRTKTREEAVLLNRETQCLYINGAAGGAGITSSIQQVVSVDNILVPRSDVPYYVKMEEVRS